MSLEKLLLGFFLVILKLQGGPKMTKFGVFLDPTRKLFALTPERGRILYSEKNLLSTDGCSTRNATFRELRRTNPLRSTRHIIVLKK